MFFRKLEKGRGIIKEDILTARKSFFQRDLVVFSSHKLSFPFV